jgi:AcrR family transcriptional regulator
MAGLRAKQKADKTSRIVEAATMLFRKSGYDTVKMEDIAAEAEVSVGTIYNYYANKGDLLVAIVAMEVEEVIASGEKVLAKPPASAQKAVTALMSVYIEHSLVWLDKSMWRQAMAIAIQQPLSPFGKSYAEQDDGLRNQTGRLVSVLQQHGMIKRDMDGKTLGEILFNNVDRMFMEFIKDDRADVKDLLKDIARHNKVLLGSYAIT